MATPVSVVGPDSGILLIGIGPDGLYYPLQLGAGGAGAATSPTPTVVSRQEHLASAALPAAGAFSAQSYYAPTGGLPRVVAFWVTYTRGAAGGRPKFRVDYGNGVETDASEVILGDSVAATAPYGQQELFMGEFLGPAPADGNPIRYIVPVLNNVGASAIRLRAAEVGVPGTPGTCALAIMGSSA